jgi:hypothetical protein
MPFPLQFFLAFIVVLGLIGIAAWLVRRLGAGRLGGVGMRGRQPRLAVVDYASVDGRRRLILVRRDNVEHLVMIGGPSDIVVESNIVRALPATREVPVARPPTMVEPPPPRAIPIPAPEPVTNGVWQLQAEPAVPAAAPRVPRNEPFSEEPAAWPLQPQAEAQPRAPRDTLAALADELSTRPAAPQRARPQANRPQPPELRPEMRAEPRQEPRQEQRQEPRAEPRQEPFPEPRVAAALPVASDVAAAADRSLAEMAQQLEAALRKPTAKPERSEPRAPAVPRAAAPSEPATPAPAPAVAASTPNGSAPRNARTPEVKPPSRPDAKQAPAGKTLYDSLEQEMASLLGRPTAKN